MDPKELRGLMEAYSEVYAPQEEIDEAVKGESSERRMDLAAERKAGLRPKSAKEGEAYASHKLSQMAYVKRQRMGEEVEQIDEISQKTATSAYAQRRTGEFEGDDASDRVAKTNKLKGRIEKKFGAKAGEHAEKAADVKTFGRKDASGRRQQRPEPRIQTSDHENQREFKRELRIKRDRRLRAARGEDTNEQVDIFDVVLEFLQVEGYVETLEEAEWLMANVIDEEAIDIILGEEQLDELSNRTVSNALNARIAATGAASDRAYKHRNPEAMRAAETAAGKEASMRSAVAKRRARMNNEEYMDEAEKPFPYEKVKKKQVSLRDKGGNALDRRMQMGAAVRRAKEAEKTGGSQRDAGKGWYHAKEAFEAWLDEAMSSYDKNRKRAAARAEERNRLRQAGKLSGPMERISLRDKFGDAAGTRMAKAKPPGPGEKY
jgi:hypothetical protein